jgi:hypothetical protein
MRESLSHKLNKFDNNNVIKLKCFILTKSIYILENKTLMDLSLCSKLIYSQNYSKIYINKHKCMDQISRP